MTIDCTTLEKRIKNIENEMTEKLGFVLPETITYDEAMTLLTTIDEPLRTSIKEKILTRQWGCDEWGLRWAVISTIVRFGMRFGETRYIAIDLADDFYNEITAIGQRVRELLQDPTSFPPTRYGYLKCAVGSFIEAMRSYDCERLRLVNIENFIVLKEDRVGHYFGTNDLFSGISEAIYRMAQDRCKTSVSDAIPEITHSLCYVDDQYELERYKEKLNQMARMIRIFNEILDNIKQ